MANITEEGTAFEEMIKAAQDLDRRTKIKPQECSIDDDCEACGS
jgi:hypothetical protein|tara:strand:- start:5190 stop:5321 length:132 start_codon:yes stop_codon:yes gene_type:complete